MKFIIIVILLVGCSSVKPPTIYIENHDKYGNLKNGFPENDTLIQLKGLKGQRLGEGKFAMAEGEISHLKVGNWKEYENDIISSEGMYRLGRYVECSAVGPVAQFYYYRTGEWIYYNSMGEVSFKLNFEPTEHHVQTNCEGGDVMSFGIVKEVPLEYWGEITYDKIYELQKIIYEHSDYLVTMIPLNGIVHYKVENKF
nr:hypothetical protein [uncultured Allomuricauda sp.]